MTESMTAVRLNGGAIVRRGHHDIFPADAYGLRVGARKLIGGPLRTSGDPGIISVVTNSINNRTIGFEPRFERDQEQLSYLYRTGKLMRKNLLTVTFGVITVFPEYCTGFPLVAEKARIPLDILPEDVRAKFQEIVSSGKVRLSMAWAQPKVSEEDKKCGVSKYSLNWVNLLTGNLGRNRFACLKFEWVLGSGEDYYTTRYY